jgi:hypothetical protein
MIAGFSFEPALPSITFSFRRGEGSGVLFQFIDDLLQILNEKERGGFAPRSLIRIRMS